MQEASIVRWHKSVGDAVSEGEQLADLETDKVEMTLEAPVAGTLSAIVVGAGDIACVGDLLAVID